MHNTTTAVVEALADERGVPPGEFGDPLYEAIDPEALEALLASGTARVTFEYDGYEVTVSSDGEVDVVPLGHRGISDGRVRSSGSPF